MYATLCSSVNDCFIDLVWKMKTGETHLRMHLKATIRLTISKALS